mmetsp:Transcript_12989/g.25932  ORF Transcript_12989/g.25932 Transcript_12989/m.25932 type:complete len:154 (+) Transcript_12989:220-681(+)
MQALTNMVARNSEFPAPNTLPLSGNSGDIQEDELLDGQFVESVDPAEKGLRWSVSRNFAGEGPLRFDADLFLAGIPGLGDEWTRRTFVLRREAGGPEKKRGAWSLLDCSDVMDKETNGIVSFHTDTTAVKVVRGKGGHIFFAREEILLEGSVY